MMGSGRDKEAESGRWQRLKASVRAGLSNYRRMLAYVRPYRAHLGVVAASLLVLSLLGLALPWAVKELVDLVVLGQDIAQLNRIALILAAILLLRTALGFVQAYLTAWVGERVVVRLRRDLFDHLLSLPLGFFAQQRVGALVSRMGSDVQIIQSAVTSNLVSLVQQLVTTGGILVIVATMSWRLTLLMGVAMPGVVLITRAMGRRIRAVARAVQDILAQTSAIVEETAGGIRIVQSFTREDHESARFGAEVQKLFDAAMVRTRVYATLGPLISLLLYGSMVLVLWVGGQEVLQGRLTPGELIAFVFYAFMLSGPLGGFAGLYGNVQHALGATERVFELLDAQSEIVEAPDAYDLPPAAGHVIFHDVDFDYDPRQPVLRRVSLEARPGEVIALVGPSGVGKTTLVNLIPRFYDPTSGRITVDGHDIRQVTLRSLREQIGIVPQETLLFSDSIEANIRYGQLDASREEVEAAARAANAHEFIVNELPDGYETQVGERGVKLSGGQRQRLAIARAILKNPRILLLDEATSALDTESERLVQEALQRLIQPDGSEGAGRTTFVIAHRLSTIVHADRILVLHDGQIAEQGTHEELLAIEGGLYRHYHDLQFRWDEIASPEREQGVPQSGSEATDWDSFRLPLLPSNAPASLAGLDEGEIGA